MLLVPRAEVPSIDSGQVHRHGGEPPRDFKSITQIRRFPIIFNVLNIKHLQSPCWNNLGYLGLFSVNTVTIWLHHYYRFNSDELSLKFDIDFLPNGGGPELGDTVRFNHSVRGPNPCININGFN